MHRSHVYLSQHHIISSRYEFIALQITITVWLMQIDAAAAGAAALMDYSEDGALNPMKDPIGLLQELVEITLKTQLNRLLLKSQALRCIFTDRTVLSIAKKWLFRRITAGTRKPNVPNSGRAAMTEW